MAIAGGVGQRSLVCVGLSATQSHHARNGSRTGDEWTRWFTEPAKNELEGLRESIAKVFDTLQSEYNLIMQQPSRTFAKRSSSFPFWGILYSKELCYGLRHDPRIPESNIMNP